MQKEQIKTILINTLTFTVVMGIFGAGYYIYFRGPTTVIIQATSVAKIAEETALIGTEIDYTVRDLGELSSAIANSAIIFELPAFKNLQDLSTQVPAEPVGRTNPFEPIIPATSPNESAPASQVPSI